MHFQNAEPTADSFALATGRRRCPLRWLSAVRLVARNHGLESRSASMGRAAGSPLRGGRQHVSCIYVYRNRAKLWLALVSLLSNAAFAGPSGATPNTCSPSTSIASYRTTQPVPSLITMASGMRQSRLTAATAPTHHQGTRIRSSALRGVPSTCGPRPNYTAREPTGSASV